MPEKLPSHRSIKIHYSTLQRTLVNDIFVNIGIPINWNTFCISYPPFQKIGFSAVIHHFIKESDCNEQK